VVLLGLKTDGGWEYVDTIRGASALAVDGLRVYNASDRERLDRAKRDHVSVVAIEGGRTTVMPGGARAEPAP
jgi:hypothetical protein